MKTIELTKGLTATVDDCDYDFLMQFHWVSCKSGNTYYAIRSHKKNGKLTTRSMHRDILELPMGDRRQCDHINHNALDNQRSNLRIVNVRQNAENRIGQSCHGAGVYLRHDSPVRPFQLMMWINGKRRSVGYFRSAKDAELARSELLASLK